MDWILKNEKRSFLKSANQLSNQNLRKIGLRVLVSWSDKRTNTQTEIAIFCLYQPLNPALPRALKVTPTVYPHLDDFSLKLRTFLWLFRVPRSKVEANRPWGFSVMIEKNKQTDEQRLQLHIYIDINFSNHKKS